MIILTSKASEFGRKISFCDGISIQFDRLGKAEIKDEEAETLFEAGYDWIYEEGTRDIVEPAKQSEIDEAVEVQVETLQKELTDNKDRIARREQKIKTLESEVVEWKKVASELEKKINAESSKDGADVSALKQEIEAGKLHVGLLELKDSELKKMADSFGVECKDAKFKADERLVLIDKLLAADAKVKRG